MSNKHKSPAQDDIWMMPLGVQTYVRAERAACARRIAEAVAKERARCVAICDSEIEQAYRAGANAGAAESIRRRIRQERK